MLPTRASLLSLLALPFPLRLSVGEVDDGEGDLERVGEADEGDARRLLPVLSSDGLALLLDMSRAGLERECADWGETCCWPVDDAEADGDEAFRRDSADEGLPCRASFEEGAAALGEAGLFLAIEGGAECGSATACACEGVLCSMLVRDERRFSTPTDDDDGEE